MSKLLKAEQVIVDKPRNLTVLPCAVRQPAAVDHAPQKQVSEDWDKPVKAFIDESEEIIRQAKLKGIAVYNDAREQGEAEGYEQGAREGALQVGRRVDEAKQCAAAVLESHKRKLDAEHEQTVREINDETMRFAVALASKILGRQLDGSDGQYATLFEHIHGGPEKYGLLQQTAALSPETVVVVSPSANAAAQPPEKPVTVEDILQLDIVSRQKLLAQVDIRDVVTALKGVDRNTVGVLLSSFPDRMQDTIREELGLSGPVSSADAVKAAGRIGRVLRRLEAAGEI